MDRLRNIDGIEDFWRSGPLEWAAVRLDGIEVAVDGSWSSNRQSAAKGAGDSTCNECEAELTVLVHKRPFLPRSPCFLEYRYSRQSSWSPMQSPSAVPIGSQTVALNPNYSNVNNKNRAATVRPSMSATRHAR